MLILNLPCYLVLPSFWSSYLFIFLASFYGLLTSYMLSSSIIYLLASSKTELLFNIICSLSCDFLVWAFFITCDNFNLSLSLISFLYSSNNLGSICYFYSSFGLFYLSYISLDLSVSIEMFFFTIRLKSFFEYWSLFFLSWVGFSIFWLSIIDSSCFINYWLVSAKSLMV